MLKQTHTKRVLFFLFFDIFLSLISLYVAFELRFSFEIPTPFLDNFWKIFLVLLPLKIAFLIYYNIYKVAWRFFSLNEGKKILKAHIYSYIVFIFIFLSFENFFLPFARSILMIDFVLSFLLLGMLRISKRLIIENNTHDKNNETLIIGANSITQMLIRENNTLNICSIVDDDAMIIDSYFVNIKVQDSKNLSTVIKEMNIKTVVIAKNFEQKKLLELYEQMNTLGIKDIKIATMSEQEKKIKDLTVEDLLARHPKDLDKTLVENFIKNKTILVTGAGGSIGSEISRQCERFGAKKLILLDSSEYNLYAITEELTKVEIVSVMQSVVNKEFLEETFKTHMPDIVIHAAAYKHVPLVEANIHEGILNNVIGTKNVIDLSIKYGVKKFVMISTDKAVRPTNVMGATKRICELYAQNAVSSENAVSLKNANGTDIVAVRFGNVLGSSGSVIPKFKSQIEKGQNITVTHPDITRYFMLIPEACELVLQAGAIGTGGEIFILDMGEPIKIVDLAKKMISLSGREDITIEFTGLRPGEKLYEELLIDETESKTEYESITVAKPTLYDIDILNKDIEELLACANQLDKLKEIVPEFNHQLNGSVTVL
ncbi:MAG: nucleoside-diphosphate sugar epimerase/dehydratase [Campylobacterales bacterium]|nr:nucleoside-diphosphate sugar epimerase/dehydratase [Campylobacterales bacterium]